MGSHDTRKKIDRNSFPWQCERVHKPTKENSNKLNKICFALSMENNTLESLQTEVDFYRVSLINSAISTLVRGLSCTPSYQRPPTGIQVEMASTHLNPSSTWLGYLRVPTVHWLEPSGLLPSASMLYLQGRWLRQETWEPQRRQARHLLSRWDLNLNTKE